MPDSTHSQQSVETSKHLLVLVAKLANELHPNVRHTQGISLESSLDKDLGFDSLARVELIQRVEQYYGVSLSDDAFASVEKIADILALLQSKRYEQPPFDRSVLSSFAEVEVPQYPEQALTLIDVLNWHLQLHPDRPHIEMHQDAGHGLQINFGQLASHSYRVAWGLIDKQVSRGARVTLMLPTGPEYFYSFMGVLAAGAVPVPIYPPTRISRIESYIRRHQTILNNCQAEVMITTPEVKGYSPLLKSLAPSINHVVTVGEFSGFSHQPTKLNIKASDTAFIQYTSGSTAAPKGVILSHANLLANIRAMGLATQLTSQDVFVSWLPLYHDMGLIGAWLGIFYHSARLVVMSPMEFLIRPRRWLWAIHRYRGTISAAPNFAYDLCVHRINGTDLEGLDLSSWRIACNGAEPVVPETVHKFCKRFADYGFRPEAYWPVYGLAEASVGLAFPKPGQPPFVHRVARDIFVKNGIAKEVDLTDNSALEFVACGRALKGHQMRIVDDNDRELPDGQEGHLQFTGPSATSGYFENPGETEKLFHGEWLDTGDLAYFNAGQVFLTGRIKDIIIRGGRNIYPHEIEDAVAAVPGVRRGRVVAFGTQLSVDSKELLVVLAETRETDKERQQAIRQAILAACSDIVDLPPDDIVLAPPNTILKTSSGKLRRSACRDLYDKGEIGKKASPLWWQFSKIAILGLGVQASRQWSNVKALCYASYVWLLFVLVSLFVCVTIFFIPGLGRRRKYASWMCNVLRCCCRIPIEVEGLEGFDPDTPCVIVANHASYLDVFCLVARLPYRFQFIAKAEFERNVFIKVMLQRVGVAFVERFERGQSIEDVKKLSQLDESILIFPEGTFTRMPGLANFHMGAFSIAAETQRPVVPIAISGTRSILRAGSWFPRWGSVAITIGKAIAAPAGEDSWHKATMLKNQARQEILAHCHEPDLESD